MNRSIVGRGFVPFSICVLALFIVTFSMNLNNWTAGLTKNHAHWDDRHADVHLRPILTSATPAEIEDAVNRFADSSSLWSITETSRRDDSLTIRLVRTTRLFRFRDDITIVVTPQTADAGDAGPARRLIHADSRSRVGKGDLGQNARNLRALHQGLQTRLPGGYD